MRALLLVVECNGDTLLAHVGLMTALACRQADRRATTTAQARQEAQDHPMKKAADRAMIGGQVAGRFHFFSAASFERSM